MTQQCVTAERIGAILELPANDPRRVHLQECPRCRSLALAYQAFTDDGLPLPAGARPKDARNRLEADLRAAIYDSPRTSSAQQQLEPTLARPSTPRRRASAWGVFAPRPTWALAGLLLVVGAGALFLLLPRDGAAPLVLRNDSSRPRVDANFVLSQPQAEGVGRWRLSWTPVDGADAYQVRFFSSDLDPLAQIEPVPVLSIGVTRDQLGADAASGNVVLWRVVALRGGDVVATSAVGTIALVPAAGE